MDRRLPTIIEPLAVSCRSRELTVGSTPAISVTSTRRGEYTSAAAERSHRAAGKNLYPEDIERAAEGVEACRKGCVVAVRIDAEREGRSRSSPKCIGPTMRTGAARSPRYHRPCAPRDWSRALTRSTFCMREPYPKRRRESCAEATRDDCSASARTTRRCAPADWLQALREIGDGLGVGAVGSHPLRRARTGRAGGPAVGCPPVPLAHDVHERRHQHHPDQGGVDQDRQRQAEAEHPHERHLAAISAANEIDMISAAAVTTRPVRAMPSATLSSLSRRRPVAATPARTRGSATPGTPRSPSTARRRCRTTAPGCWRRACRSRGAEPAEVTVLEDPHHRTERRGQRQHVEHQRLQRQHHAAGQQEQQHEHDDGDEPEHQGQPGGDGVDAVSLTCAVPARSTSGRRGRRRRAGGRVGRWEPSENSGAVLRPSGTRCRRYAVGAVGGPPCAVDESASGADTAATSAPDTSAAYRIDLGGAIPARRGSRRTTWSRVDRRSRRATGHRPDAPTPRWAAPGRRGSPTCTPRNGAPSSSSSATTASPIGTA